MESEFSGDLRKENERTKGSGEGREEGGQNAFSFVFERREKERGSGEDKETKRDVPISRANLSVLLVELKG